MIGLEDRQSLAHDIHTAHKAGARLRLACETAGIDVRTLQRWNAGAGLVSGDGRLHAVRVAGGVKPLKDGVAKLSKALNNKGAVWPPRGCWDVQRVRQNGGSSRTWVSQ